MLRSFLFIMFLTTKTFTQECINEIKFKVGRIQNDIYVTEEVESTKLRLQGDIDVVKIETHAPYICNDTFVFRQLANLYANNIQLKKIDAGAFNCQNITEQIILRSNFLRRIYSGTFSEMSVYEIDLSENLIEILEEDAFSNLPNLKKLLFNTNLLKQLDPKSIRVNGLTNFDLSNNKLVSLVPHQFVFMESNVSHLNLGENQLSEIHVDSFEGVKLSELNLTTNQLSTIPDELFEDSAFTVLDFSDNHIGSLEENFFKQKHLQVVFLKGNPIMDCCTLEKVVRFARSNYVIIYIDKDNCDFRKPHCNKLTV